MNKDNVLVVIPARSGSKGVPGKNIRSLAGKPLILHTVEVARQVFCDENIIVSTDSAEIIRIVEQTGLKVPFIRPSELSSDNSGMYEVLIHALNSHKKITGFKKVVLLLQPTSPLRTADHIEQALNLYDSTLDMVVSVTESKMNPYFNLFEKNNIGFLEKCKPGDYGRRQDCPEVFAYNGAIYVINTKSLIDKTMNDFTRIIPYKMDEISSIDIDSQFDWDLAEYVMLKNSNS
jgi:CMP-N,N'-diacetyllegionaminic acid synthase